MTLTSLVVDIRQNHARDSSQQTWRTAAVSGGVDFNNIWAETVIQAKHGGGGIVIVIFWKAELQIWLRGHRKTRI